MSKLCDVGVQKECVAATRQRHALQPDELRSGFGLHAISSLEMAIRRARAAKHVCLCLPVCGGEDGGGGEAELEGETASLGAEEVRERLKYLMGLPSGEEEEAAAATVAAVGDEDLEEGASGGGEEDVGDEDADAGVSEAMRRAQRYLRAHHVFELFQFLVAHLLAALPFDPVAFLVNLCDKLLIYRSGICAPPLLFDKPHIECLFDLMDRMRTGLVDREQYATGMQTLGVQSFNREPPLTAAGLVTKCYFVDEAYECLTDLLDDMIRKRAARDPRKGRARVPRAPPPSMALSVCASASAVDLAL